MILLGLTTENLALKIITFQARELFSVLFNQICQLVHQTASLVAAHGGPRAIVESLVGSLNYNKVRLILLQLFLFWLILEV